jgi:exosortase
MIGALILFLITYASTIVWMAERWFAPDSYYSHGLLVPIVSLGLIWQNRQTLKNLPQEGSSWGVRVFILALLIHAVGLMFRIYFLSGFSMVLCIVGFVWGAYGARVLKEVAFPIGFLLFMVPIPLVLIVNMSFQLKLFSAQIATGFLNLIQIPAVQQGSYIQMPHASVVVEDVCSGLRSLISLMAMASLFAYWIKASLWKRVALLLSSIPIAVITNMVRITVLSVMNEKGMGPMAEAMHQGLGFFVFALALVLLIGLEKILTKGWMYAK